MCGGRTAHSPRLRPRCGRIARFPLTIFMQRRDNYDSGLISAVNDSLSMLKEMQGRFLNVYISIVLFPFISFTINKNISVLRNQTIKSYNIHSNL